MEWLSTIVCVIVKYGWFLNEVNSIKSTRKCIQLCFYATIEFSGDQDFIDINHTKIISW